MSLPPPTVPLMAGRLLKVSSLATAVFASSGFYLYSRQLDLNDLSVIRFGRAAATVSLHLWTVDLMHPLQFQFMVQTQVL